MRSLLFSFQVFSGIIAQARPTNLFYTPWYGAIGFHTISTDYSSSGTDIKAPLTFAYLRAVFFIKKGYMEF